MARTDRLAVYHNPRCSKSRGVVEILEERGVAFDVVEYLSEPPDRSTLERLVELISLEPAELVRKDGHFKELGLDEADYQTKDAVVSLLLEHPRLMQRPIVVKGDVAVIGRPPENVETLL